MSHRAHPVDFDPTAALLWDDCPRCDEQAREPSALDEVALQRAWGLMLRVERVGLATHKSSPRYLTAAEATLGRTLNRIYVVIERLGGVKANGRPGNV